MDQKQTITPHLSNELNAIFENAAVMLVLVDKQGRIININSAGLSLIKKEKDQVIGKQNGEVFSCINAIQDGVSVCGHTENCKNCTVRQQINKSLQGIKLQEKENGKLTIFDKNGKHKVIHLLVSISNINIDDKEYMLLTIDEITKIKKQEEELKRINQDKNKFLSILSHDLRSPYNSFIGFTEILLKSWRTMPPEKVDKILRTLLSVSKSSYELLDDLLIWAKSQSGKIQFEPEILDCQKIFDSVYQSIKYSADLKQLDIQLDAAGNCKILADAKMLSTILRNLLSNAIKFSEKEKKIIVEIRKQEEKTSISVIDHGVGIAKSNLDHLFDITRVSSSQGTDGEKGTGLGLLLCKEFVDTHKGKILVTSKLGQGSTFTFTLPNKAI